VPPVLYIKPPFYPADGVDIVVPVTETEHILPELEI
jgi:hypothetical protein